MPKRTINNDNSPTFAKMNKKLIENKRKFMKVCQKLHLLHNNYCINAAEAKQYEKDFRLQLIPSLIAYHETILTNSGENEFFTIIGFTFNSFVAL